MSFSNHKYQKKLQKKVGYIENIITNHITGQIDKHIYIQSLYCTSLPHVQTQNYI